MTLFRIKKNLKLEKPILMPLHLEWFWHFSANGVDEIIMEKDVIQEGGIA